MALMDTCGLLDPRREQYRPLVSPQALPRPLVYPRAPPDRVEPQRTPRARASTPHLAARALQRLQRLRGACSACARCPRAAPSCTPPSCRTRRDIMVDYAKWDKMKFSDSDDDEEEAAAAPRPPPQRGSNPMEPTPPREELPTMRLTRELARDLEALLQRLPADTTDVDRENRTMLKDLVKSARSHADRGVPLSTCLLYEQSLPGACACSPARPIHRRRADQGAAQHARGHAVR